MSAQVNRGRVIDTLLPMTGLPSCRVSTNDTPILTIFGNRATPVFRDFKSSWPREVLQLVSGKNSLYRMVLFHPGQSDVQPLKSCRQSPVINSQTMQDRCIHVVNVNGVFCDVVAEIVGLTVDDARFNSAASHPD